MSSKPETCPMEAAADAVAALRIMSTLPAEQLADLDLQRELEGKDDVCGLARGLLSALWDRVLERQGLEAAAGAIVHVAGLAQRAERPIGWSAPGS